MTSRPWNSADTDKVDDAPYTIGVDVGGTFTRAGVVTNNGQVRHIHRTETPRANTGPALVTWIANAVDALIAAVGEPEGREIRYAGVGLPGIVDAEEGRLVRSVNLPLLEGFAVRDELVRRTGLAWRVTTDAAAATWGEYIGYCVANGARPKRFAHLRLGTGVALGAVIDGVLDVGPTDATHPFDERRTGHLDLLRVIDGADAPLCRCGQRGCLEAIASGRALAERAASVGLGDDLAELARLGENGDAAARQIIDRAADAVSMALSNIANHYRADVVVVGGGVAKVLHELVSRAIAKCGDRRVGFEPRSESTDAQPRYLRSEIRSAGVVGAAEAARAGRTSRRTR